MNSGYFVSPLVVKCIPKEKSSFRFEVFHSFTYITKDGESICVPVKFKTDFASVPWAFRHFIPQSGRYNEAAVVHDYLCYLWKKGKYDRERADGLFYEMMEVLGVKGLKRKVMFMGVGLYTKMINYRLMPVKRKYKHSGKVSWRDRVKTKKEAKVNINKKEDKFNPYVGESHCVGTPSLYNKKQPSTFGYNCEFDQNKKEARKGE